MEADFGGWATKANLKCSDGRTIAPDAFKHQDQLQVPLVWQHGHTDPENVLGHAILTNKPEGVWTEAYFNDTPKAQHAKTLVQHRDITKLSIWANQLVERSKVVFHGAIREVSLVLSGANPGATIDPVTIRHSDESITELDDECIIQTGEDIVLVHSDAVSDVETPEVEAPEAEAPVVEHANDPQTGDQPTGEITLEEAYNTMNDVQKDVVHYMVAQAIADNSTGSGSDSQTNAQHDSTGADADKEGTNSMSHNVFDQSDEGVKPPRETLSHDDMKAILAEGLRVGSMKEAANNAALAHSVEALDLLFPDAQATDTVPEWIKRQTEWVAGFLSATRKTPFSRIKTLQADITHEEARAKGYVKGAMKKDEYFGLLKRVTTPTTVYKKQAIDRDDWVDITDFDVAIWLKAEMRVMLDEEVARAGLIGDGRDISSEDKINEQNIRPIAKDNELYTTQVWVPLGGAASFNAFVDAVTNNRKYYKGTGQPNLYTTETYISMALTLRDSLGRKIYKTIDELATELRVKEIIPVEALEDEPEIIGIMVNPVDYVYGASRGGEVNLFDDFDIDFNKQKYLIETRCCGALVKVKSAICFRTTGEDDDPIEAVAPTMDEDFEVTIPTVAGAAYRNEEGTNIEGTAITLTPGQVLQVFVTPDTGKYLTPGVHYWNFVRPTV